MFEITETLRERVFTHDDLPALTVALRYPVVSGGTGKAAWRVNMFYSHLAKTLEKYAGTYLLPDAVRDCKQQLASSRPYREKRVTMDCETSVMDSVLTVKRTLTAGGRVSAFVDRWDEDGWALSV